MASKAHRFVVRIRWVVFVLAGKVLFLLYLGVLAEQFMWWQWLVDPRTSCSHKPLPANHSGVRVLAGGMAKTGTSTMVEAFHLIGLTNAYHGNDVSEHILRPVLDDFWRQPRNGGDGNPWSIATVRAPAHMGTLFRGNLASRYAFERVRPEDLAAAISKCRVDAMSFDAVESMFFPVYDVSPGAKVVILSWRSYEDFDRSRNAYGLKFRLFIYSASLIANSIQLLPWGALILPAFNMVTGGHIDNVLRNGTSLTFSRGASLRFYHHMVFNRHDLSHANSGIAKYIWNKWYYLRFFEQIRERVPAKDRMEWNMKNNTPKDLCDFLGIKGHPGCNKPLPRVKVEILRFDRNEWHKSLGICCPIYIMCHILNYKLFYGTLSILAGLMPRRRRTKTE